MALRWLETEWSEVQNGISREIRFGAGTMSETQNQPLPKGHRMRRDSCQIGSQSLHSSDEAGQHKPVEQREVGRLMRGVEPEKR